jgi:NADPH2:quinone reductase
MSVSEAAPMMAGTHNSQRLRVHTPANDVSNLDLQIEDGNVKWSEDEVVVEVGAAAINPSDVKATLGLMPHAHWPRTPGRDFAGTIVEGPAHLIGVEVWGSSGELGIRRDGSHGTHLVLNAADVREKPHKMSMVEAGSVGVPFVTAWNGFRRSGFPKPGENVLVLGATGKVGQAAIQIATMLGAKTIGVMREGATFDGYHANPVKILAGNSPDTVAEIRAQTDGRGVDIAFNTVGSPYYDVAHRSMALHGRQIFIATVDKTVPFNILEFYRGQHTYVGIDTLALTTRESADILAEMSSGFESGALKPFPILPSSIYGLEQAKEAYAKVLGSSKDRLVFAPNGRP